MGLLRKWQLRVPMVVESADQRKERIREEKRKVLPCSHLSFYFYLFVIVEGRRYSETMGSRLLPEPHLRSVPFRRISRDGLVCSFPFILSVNLFSFSSAIRFRHVVCGCVPAGASLCRHQQCHGDTNRCLQIPLHNPATYACTGKLLTDGSNTEYDLVF